MMARTIVHLTTFLQGGAGGAVAALACAQRRAGHRVSVLTSATGEPGYGHYAHHLEELRRGGVAVELVDSLFKRDPRLNAAALARLEALHPNGVDVLHAHAGVPAAIALRYSAVHPGPSVVQTQHGWGTRKTADQEREDLQTLHKVDAVVATSEATRALLVSKGLDPRRVGTVPCGIAAALPGEPSLTAHATVEPLRQNGYAVAGCIGSVTTTKNQRLLIDALAQHRDLDLAIVCIGEGGAELNAYAKARGVSAQVIMAGYQPDAARWLPLFDLLVVPSLAEGQGIAVMEAARARVPVVASDIPALREFIIDNETGWLFQSNNADALADRLDEALQCPVSRRARLTAAAHARFLAHGALDVMVARHEALYARLGSRAGVPAS